MSSDERFEIGSSSWGLMLANPVFRSLFLPRSIRGLAKSPILRALILTPLVILIYEAVQRTMANVWLALGSAVFFWFMIIAVQKYFCWLEFTLLARSGRLSDYRNSGLSTEDIVLGVIYPSEIASSISILLVLGWWMFVISGPMAWVIGAFIVMQIIGMMVPSDIPLTDVETYLRKRNPLALFFISLSVAVPLVIFFGIFFLIRLLLAVALILFPAVPVSPVMQLVAALLAAMYLGKFPTQRWERFRLERFFLRYDSLEDLFDQFVAQAENSGEAK